MYLSPTPEQQELKDAVRRFCQEQIVAERLAAGAASCSVTCAFSAMFYLHCFAKCTAGYAIYAIVYCAALQF